jgi:hypothetical protein
MDKEAAIGMISRQMPDMVHVSNPKAYDAFSGGRCIYDFDERGLEEFSKKNSAEFDDWIVGGPSGPFRQIEALPGVTIYFTYHKHRAPEDIIRRHLHPAEKERPDLA